MTSTQTTPLDCQKAAGHGSEALNTCSGKRVLVVSVFACCVFFVQITSAMHPAFENAGKSPGLEIWRIENFSAVPYPRSDYGKFYTGDSYIVLFTKQLSRSANLSWDIHFWLGNDTSQDEAGSAAILSVDLDDSLGGSPIQYREVQEHESDLFLSHFPSGVRYLPGGVASGFTHVDPNAVEKRLFQVKGKRNVRVRQVALDVSSMNKGDCFILDAGRDIFVYVGQNSKRTERLKAISAANQIRDQDHAGRAKVNILDEYSSEIERSHFFEALGSGSPAAVAAEAIGGDDMEFERQVENNVTLYKVSDESGNMVVQKVAEKPLHQNMLLSSEEGGKDCFILDTITSGLFVWIGRHGTRNEKVEAMRKAQQFLSNNNYPQWTRIQRIVQDGEPSSFKQYFSGWREASDQMGLGRAYGTEAVAASSPQRNVHASSPRSGRARRMAKSGGCAIGFMPDDGQGQVEVWNIVNFELEPIPEEKIGFFFGGDSYVIKYTYEKATGIGYIIYFWQGKDSSQDERAASALHAVRLDNEVSGRAIQVRVTQGNEPRHFLKTFKGRLVVFMGGHASGFRNIHDYDTYDVDGTRLFEIRGTCPDDTRAIQVPEVAASLNSDDAFVLETPNNTYIWHGQGCSDEEKEMAVNASALVAPGRDPIIVGEGEEPAEFWEALGGQGEYRKGFVGHSSPILDPRLFHCHINPQGKFSVEEIDNFKQEDLDEDDVMVLDSGDEIYIWIGDKSISEEREQAMKMAEEYLKADPTDRSHELTLIFTLKQGEETINFTSLFPSWDPSAWEALPTYEDLKKQVDEVNSAQEE